MASWRLNLVLSGALRGRRKLKLDSRADEEGRTMSNHSDETGAEALDRALNNFYRDPNPVEAALALEHAMKTGLIAQVPIFYGFARIAATSAAARTAFERLRALGGKSSEVVDTLLAAPAHPEFPQPLAMPIEHPEVLDLLWAEFGVSGDLTCVMRVVSVLDWEDVVRLRLQEWLEGTGGVDWEQAPYRDYRQTFLRCVFPINYESRTIDGPVDLDLHAALLARNGELKFAALPIELALPELLHLAMKSAALWSLRCFARTHAEVARLCSDEAEKPGGAGRAHLNAPRPPD
jgi:hypothetical protein